MEQGLARLTVLFASARVEVGKEVPAYTPVSLLSSVGGSLSIFMGISTLSYLELAEFFVRKALRR